MSHCKKISLKALCKFLSEICVISRPWQTANSLTGYLALTLDYNSSFYRLVNKSQTFDSCVSPCFPNKKTVIQEVSTESSAMRRILNLWDTFLVLTVLSAMSTQFILIVITAMVLILQPSLYPADK